MYVSMYVQSELNLTQLSKQAYSFRVKFNYQNAYAMSIKATSSSVERQHAKDNGFTIVYSRCCFRIIIECSLQILCPVHCVQLRKIPTPPQVAPWVLQLDKPLTLTQSQADTHLYSDTLYIYYNSLNII